MGFRYIGSKNGILANIIQSIESIIPKNSHVIDAMAGTGAVSIELRKRGYSVTACDVMTYSFHHCRVALLFSEYPKFVQSGIITQTYTNDSLFKPSPYERVIHYLNNIKPDPGYFYKEFSPEGKPDNGAEPRNYFSPENAALLDALRKEIYNLHSSTEINDLEHSLLLHDLILAVNDVANTAGTYGHYLSKLRKRSLEKIKLQPTQLLVKPDSGMHKVVQGYIESLAPSLIGDLCYIDPPYMKRQYAANYHILETIAREDFPEAVGKSGLRPWRDQYSDFCSKVKIRKAFTKVIEGMHCSNFLISYSDEGLLTINELKEFLNSFGNLSYTSFSHKRFKSRDEKGRKQVKEYLFHLQKTT